jgi:hypothetical protein
LNTTLGERTSAGSYQRERVLLEALPAVLCPGMEVLFGCNMQSVVYRLACNAMEAARNRFLEHRRPGHPTRCPSRNKDSIGKLLKRAAKRAGLKVDELSSHSHCAGCVTQAAMNGVRDYDIAPQTGHKTVATLRRYIRSGKIFRENAAAGLGI